MGWRDFCVGAVGGALLSIARPPAGITLEEWMTPTGERQALWRAGALIVVAIGLFNQRPRRADVRFPATELALGGAAGFAVHGLGLIDLLAIDSAISWSVALVLGLCAMLLLRPKAPTEAVETGAPPTALFLRVALALCGAGLAIVFSALNSRLCLFGSGTRVDDTIAGATALFLCGLGALAFAPLLSRRRLAPAWFALGLCVAAVLALPSFGFLADFSHPRSYDELLRRFGLHSDMRGTLQYDALLAARVFALPALIAGLAFASSRSAANLGYALLGAAIASVLQPHWGGGFDATTLETVSVQASERAALGLALAAIGTFCGALSAGRMSWKARVVIALCGPLAILYGREWHKPAVLPLSPWEKVAPRVEWIRETPEGLLTVELRAQQGRIATLDRRRLTPTLEELPADELRFRNSLEDRDRDEVVIIGLLTPERAMTLRILGVQWIHPVTAWPQLEVGLQAAMFAGEGLPEGLEIDRDGSVWESKRGPDGSRSGVIVGTPVESASRTLSCLDGWETGYNAVLWLPTHQAIAQLDWGSRVRASCSHIDDLSVGVGSPMRADLPAGSRAGFGTLSQLLRTLPERETAARVRATERLIRGEASASAQAARLLCLAQVQSSPFETRAQRTELDPKALDLLLQAGLATEPEGFERELDEFVSSTLEQQRNLDGLCSFAQPLADARTNWPRLQRAAARADWEFLRYADAARRLEQVVLATPYDLQARLWLSEALLRANEPGAALRAADDMLAINPGRFDAERLRALAAARDGDPRGTAWIQTLLRDHPNDAELARHAGPGPYPELEPALAVPGEATGPVEGR